MTSFSVPDPLVAIEAAGAALAQETMRRVLVVDDEATIRLALGRFLRTRGFEVEVADSGAAALEILAHRRFSLMLCDLRMPGLSGLDVVPRALALDTDLGIIMLTAVNDAASATEALSSGAFDYLTKPVELPDLQASVERAMMRRVRHMERRAIDRLVREVEDVGDQVVGQGDARQVARVLAQSCRLVHVCGLDAPEARLRAVAGHPLETNRQCTTKEVCTDWFEKHRNA